MKNLITSILVSFTLIMSVITHSQANLLSDPDGFSISLTTSDSMTNLFGPPSFTDNFNPGDGFPTVPAPFVDGTEIEVTFFDSYIEIRQFARSSFDPIGVDWLMLFENIDAPNPILSATIDDMSNTFANLVVASNTDNSISISYEGGSTDTLQVNGDEWFARVDVEFGQVEVSSPTLGMLFILAFIILITNKRLSMKKLAK